MATLERFHHRISGPENGRKWVFLHGLMGFANNWGKIVQGLQQTERCLVYDQRGHGRSFKPEAGYAAADYADDLKSILDELGWERIVLVGHSMGGRNGLNFCTRFPGRVERFVLEDIGPEMRPGNWHYYEELLGAVPTPFADRAAARTFFRDEFSKRARTRDRADMIGAFLNANLEDRPDGRTDWRFSKSAILESARLGEQDRWDEVRALSMPTLLVRGENSLELPSEIYESMLAANPLIQGVIVPGAGHWVHADQPERFLAEIRRFAGLPAGSP